MRREQCQCAHPRLNAEAGRYFFHHPSSLHHSFLIISSTFPTLLDRNFTWTTTTHNITTSQYHATAAMSDPDPNPTAIFSLALQNQRESQELSQHAARSTSINDLLTRLRNIPDAGVRGRAQYALLQVAENVAGSVESALADTID
jgi:hypothetical protein